MCHRLVEEGDKVRAAAVDPDEHGLDRNADEFRVEQDGEDCPGEDGAHECTRNLARSEKLLGPLAVASGVEKTFD